MMATKPGKTRVVDKGMKRAMAAQKSLRGHQATIGIHRSAGQHDGGISNANLGAVHEFGANIDHPGGTDYTVFGGATGRSGAFLAGAAIFLPKGDPRSIGKTRPHMIRIPERSFLRSSFDSNRRKYEDLIERQTGLVIDGTQTARGAVATVGEVALGDVVQRINTVIGPPNKPSTIARKGSRTPLIDTGQLKQSITLKVSRS